MQAPLRYLLPMALASSLFAILPAWAAEPKVESKPRDTTVFAAGEEGYHTYRIPAVVVSKKGTLLAFCEGRKGGRGDAGDIDMVLKRSTDNGKTWGKLQLVYEEGGEKAITIGNPAPVVDQKTGTIWLPFCRNNDRVFVTSSTDDGETWSQPTEITSSVKADDWTWYATGPVHGIQLTQGKRAGRLLIACDHRVAKGPWEQKGRSHTIYSDDHGRSWQRGEPTDWAMNECTVAELSGGDVLLNMRSYRQLGCRATATSRDGGVTWSECKNETSLPEPVCQGSLLRYISPQVGGESFLLFCNPASVKSRDHLTLRTSRDEGQSWSKGFVICEGSSAYSDLVQLPNGSIGVLYERDDYKRIAFREVAPDRLND
jgi:sialidase-1